MVTQDAEIYILNGTKFLLSDIEWAFGTEHAQYVLTGRLLLEALGFDTREF